MKFKYALWVAVAAGCAGAPQVDGRRQAVGEQQNGFPSPWERALYMAANRARSDPSTVKGAKSKLYPAQPPLVATYDLARSARFHAANLAKGRAPLMHESPCTLKSDVGTSGCDGTPSCACMGGTTCNSCDNCTKGTGPFDRIRYFYPAGGNGEVAAAGYSDPWGVMEGWVNEPDGADGHRQIVDSGQSGVVGFGHSDSPTGACWPTFDVGDFGAAKPAPAKIASAAPEPIGGKAGTFRIYATWADKAGGAPTKLAAVIDGKCTNMALELGDPTRNATYVAEAPLSDGCHAVYISGQDAAGTRQRYPTTTAFTIAVGAGSCANEMAQPPADCEGGAAGDGAVDGGSGAVDGSSDRDAGTADGAPRDPSDAGETEPPDRPAAGGCSIAPQHATTSSVGLLLLALLSLRRRRPERRG